jgi:chromate transporter
MSKATPNPGPSAASGVPPQSYAKLFLRFLRFGALAWGGPVAQIDMVRQELVTEEKWISPEKFRRLLAVYQALPGPEAHELCVHFGMMARGRIGGVLAGLGFMLPGFVLMFLLSWAYLKLNASATAMQAVFLGIQPAVIALIVRACHRIGGHALLDRPLWAIAVFAAVGEALGVSFYVTLPLAGVAYVLATRRSWVALAFVTLVFAVGAAWSSPVVRGEETLFQRARSAPAERADATSRGAGIAQATDPGAPGDVGAARPAEAASAMFASGLRAGLLTFGGAYTAIPFLREDAVERGAWMSERDFLDGVALAGVIPAPLIIFSTFVGYAGGGAAGALAITAGVFLPAFLFSILFYRRIEAVIDYPALRQFLEGVTAAVVAIIAVTTVELALTAIPSWRALAIFAVALLVVYRWRAKLAVPALMLGAGLAGWAMF